MDMKKTIFWIFLVSSLFAGNAYGQTFLSFSAESKQATKELSCNNSKITPASYGLGALFGCIQGSAETVKWFINESPNTNRVENVKLMWNDWFKDRGFGVHADKKQAQQALKILIKLYAPQKGKELEKAFFGNKDKTIEAEGFTLNYTFFRGPAIDERLIVVTQK